MKQNYHLNCDKCGQTYWSNEGFPEPQLCYNCSKPTYNPNPPIGSTTDFKVGQPTKAEAMTRDDLLDAEEYISDKMINSSNSADWNDIWENQTWLFHELIAWVGSYASRQSPKEININTPFFGNSGAVTPAKATAEERPCEHCDEPLPCNYLNECIKKATPNLSKIKDVDKELDEIRGVEQPVKAEAKTKPDYHNDIYGPGDDNYGRDKPFWKAEAKTAEIPNDIVTKMQHEFEPNPDSSFKQGLYSGYAFGLQDGFKYASQQPLSDEEIEKYFTSQHYDNKNGHHYRVNKDRIFGAQAYRDGKIK